jgi:predicted transcriptional regulator
MIDRKYLRKMVPHGYCKVIAKKAGVSTIAVSQYFQGKHNSYRIEKAVIKVLIELRNEQTSLLNSLKNLEIE